MAAGVDYCGPVKTSYKGFCLDMLKNLMEDWPGGSYLVMDITPRFPGGRTILSIGYTYSSRKVLGFIAKERRVEVLNQVISIYLVSLKLIIMFMFTPLFVLTG